MKTIILCALLVTSDADSLVIDFGSKGKESNWFVLNDGVMGGRSGGEVIFGDNSFTFSGEVSLENNGGFASIRSPFLTYKLQQYKQVEIRYRATGMQFALTMANSKRWYNPNYKFNLAQTQGQWKTAVILLLDFKQYQVGRETGYTIATETLNQIIRLGFISNEKRAGEFELEVDYIKFY